MNKDKSFESNVLLKLPSEWLELISESGGPQIWTIAHSPDEATLLANIKSFFMSTVLAEAPDVDVDVDEDVNAIDLARLTDKEACRDFAKNFEGVEYSCASTCWRRRAKVHGTWVAKKSLYEGVANYLKATQHKDCDNACNHPKTLVRHHPLFCELLHHRDTHNACCRPSHLAHGCRTCNRKDITYREKASERGYHPLIPARKVDLDPWTEMEAAAESDAEPDAAAQADYSDEDIEGLFD